MTDIDLDLSEAATLLGYSPETLALMVDRGHISARGTGDSIRIPVQSIARFVGIEAEEAAIRGVERVFHDRNIWFRVFGSHSELSSAAGFERFPQSATGGSLRRALAISTIRSA